MSTSRSHTWQDIHERISHKISSRVWLPGDLIPGEVELAAQYGCARTTVNRALRELARTGVIDRKRKAGTRVAMQQARTVTADIPVIRAQVEAQGHAYRFELLENRRLKPVPIIKDQMKIKGSLKPLHLRSIHYADDTPFIYEDRWINTQTVAEIKQVDLSVTSANEWLVQNVPFTCGEFIVEACAVPSPVAKALGLPKSTPVLKSQRTTWLQDSSVTTVCLYYKFGYKMRFEI